MLLRNPISRGYPSRQLIGLGHFRRLAFLVLVMAGTGLTSPLQAAEAVPEYDLKAAFVFNFARFVEWPEPARPLAEQPLVIGIVGEDPFGGSLDSIVKGEIVNGHPIMVKRFGLKDDIAKCHILYICRSESSSLPQILARLKGHAVLTVSDTDHFAYEGGTIGLVMEEGKVRIQINVDRAKVAQLALSAKLLRPALIIRDQPHSMLFPHGKFSDFGLVCSSIIPLRRIAVH